jgi:hypothetical protein
MPAEKSKISVSFSYTRNMGNFESSKIEMGIQRDLLPKEDREKAYVDELDFLKELVEDELIKIENFLKV